jgi:hypothetical protein
MKGKGCREKEERREGGGGRCGPVSPGTKTTNSPGKKINYFEQIPKKFRKKTYGGNRN